MKIEKSSDIIKVNKVTSLSLGDSGKGKTYFMGTIANHGKLFVIDSEGGLATVANRVFDYVRVNSWKEFIDALTWYFANATKEKYTHLGIDSLTRLQQYLAAEYSEDGKLTQAQWGEVLAKMRKVVDRLTKNCPTNVHVNATAAESKDELSGAIKIYPNIQGSFKYDLAGYFDIVLYHDCAEKDGKQTYWIQTQGDQRVLARSRYSAIRPLNKFELNNYSVVNNIFADSKGDAK